MTKQNVTHAKVLQIGEAIHEFHPEPSCFFFLGELLVFFKLPFLSNEYLYPTQKHMALNKYKTPLLSITSHKLIIKNHNWCRNQQTRNQLTDYGS